MAITEGQCNLYFNGHRIVSVKHDGREVQVVDGVAVHERIGDTISGGISTREFVLVGEGHVRPVPLARSPFATETISAPLTSETETVYVEPLFIDHIATVPNDPLLSAQWALGVINAHSGWSIWKGDPSQVMVAVLDSGIPLEAGGLSHADLSDRGAITIGRDVVNGDDDPADDNGHGTHVAGIIGASCDNGIGIAGLLWQPSLFVIKIFDAAGNGSSATFLEGTRFAISEAQRLNKRLVINYSGGGPTSVVKRTAVDEASRAGALLVAAAGNIGGPVDFPAAYAPAYVSTTDHVMAVSASDSASLPAIFSNFGPELSVAAPGVDILSTLPNYTVTFTSKGLKPKYDVMSGTSMATPYVSALAALVWSKTPAWSAKEVKERIVSTARMPPGGTATRLGAGIIDVEAALR